MVNEHELQTRIVAALAKVSRSAELSTQSLNSIAESLRALAKQGAGSERAGVTAGLEILQEAKTDLCSLMGMDAAEEWSTVIEEVGLYVRHDLEHKATLAEIRAAWEKDATCAEDALAEVTKVLERRGVLSA